MKKKLISLLLVIAMVAACFTGCGSGNSRGEGKTSGINKKDGEFNARDYTEGVTLTIAIPSNVKIEDFETNAMTLYIEEKLGCNLEFMTFPSSDYQKKINIMVMGGDKLPDIIMNGTDSTADWSGWIAEEVLLPLEDYYKDPDFSANITAASEQTGVDIAESLTMADGHIYYLPKFGQSVNAEVYSKFWIYEPWLKAIGKEMPTTTEEFYEVCKLIANSDLNNNGKKDEVAILGSQLSNWFPCMMSNFIYAHDAEYRYVEDGKVGFAYTTDAWKEGLKYIKKFIDEGLIPDGTLTQSEEQFNMQLYADTQTVFSFAGWNPENTKGQQWRLDFEVMLPLKSSTGNGQAMYRPSLPKIGAAISVDCKNPEAAFLVCDLLCSEEMSITTRWGERGVNWDYWEDVPDTLPDGSKKSDYSAYNAGREIHMIAYDDNAFWGNTDPQNVSWLQEGCYVWSDKVYGGRAVKSNNCTEVEAMSLKTGNELNTAIDTLHEYIPEEVVDRAPLTSDENADLADINASLTSYVKESIGSFLSGAWDIDTYWDTYLDELEKIGYQDVLEIYQTGYDRAH